jgi:hypothetical protein
MNSFVQACLNNGLIPCGQITINGIQTLINLTRGKMTWNKVPTTEETTVEAKNLIRENEREAHLATAGHGDLLALATKLGKLRDFERSTKRGDVKDNGIIVFRGFVPLSVLTNSLGLWQSGKRQSVSGRDRVFLHLSKKEDPEASRIPQSLRYWLPRIEEDAMMLVVIWVNPDKEGWLQVNFVVERFLSASQYAKEQDQFPTRSDLGFQTHANCIAEADGPSYTVNTLPMDILAELYSDAVSDLERKLRESELNQDEMSQLEAITNEKFAGRA